MVLPKDYCDNHSIQPARKGASPACPETLMKAIKDPNSGNQKEFASTIGALMHLCKTRPDIVPGVAYLSQHQKAPSETHLELAKKIWEYVFSTLDKGLTYKKSKEIRLIGYCDASWHAHESAHGHTGFYLALSEDGTPIHVKSKKQTAIALSSAEAEIMALFACVRQVMYMRMLLEDMGEPQTHPTIIYEDNQSAIMMSNQYHSNSQSRHMARKYKWINEVIRNGQVQLKYIRTDQQKADALTKITVGKSFKTSRSNLLGEQLADDEHDEVLSRSGGVSTSSNRSRALTTFDEQLFV